MILLDPWYWWCVGWPMVEMTANWWCINIIIDRPIECWLMTDPGRILLVDPGPSQAQRNLLLLLTQPSIVRRSIISIGPNCWTDPADNCEQIDPVTVIDIDDYCRWPLDNCYWCCCYCVLDIVDYCWYCYCYWTVIVIIGNYCWLLLLMMILLLLLLINYWTFCW